MPKEINIDSEISKMMQELAASIDGVLQERFSQRIGFSLSVFSPGDGGFNSYVSNCDRAEVAAALKKMISNWEAGAEDVPAHKIN